MRISETWLKEWVKTNSTTDELAAKLTMAGLEVDGVEPVAGEFQGVVVAEIIACEQHPDADKLRVCQVNVGEPEPLSIVCGAPNARVGIKVPCARIGAVLPGDFKIKKSKLRGVESHGMLCAEQELGMAESSDGLFELPADAPVGEDIRQYLKLDDNIIEVDLTPNRSDCLSIAGVARDIGVIERAEYTPVHIDEVAPVINDTFDVSITAVEQCPHYVGRVIRGVDVKAPTPLWMVERLRRSDIRSIDPVVDVTNYVLLELGQPMHAFDLDRLEGHIHVRLAESGEKLVLLNGQELELTPDSLVIADASGALALAGVMGGAGSGVTETTRDIFLESAFFDPIAIAGKARGYGLHTDSSHRFERGVDFELQKKAMERATSLLCEIAGGKPGPIIEASYPDHFPKLEPINLRRSQIQRVLGFAMKDNDVEDILERLGMDLVSTESGWHIVPPAYRFDIRIEVDLIEELGRVWGYNNLPTRLPAMNFEVVPAPENRIPESRIKQLLVDRGYQEAITYTFVEKALLDKLAPDTQAVELANPISADMSHMRTSIWAGLLKVAQHNINRQQHRVRLFETGLVFSEQNGIYQQPHIGGLLFGDVTAESWHAKGRSVDFFDIKADVESLINLSAEPEAFSFAAAEHPALHPGQAAVVSRGDQIVGYLGALHPVIQKALDIPGPVYLFDLEMAAISARTLPSFKELSRFPEVRRDLAVIVQENIPAEAILRVVRAETGEWLTSSVIFDVYQGDNLKEGHKSVAFGLTLQHPSRTLKDEEVNDVVNRVVASLKEQLNVTLRE
ncbi:MAG: phenylalanine--tRNA ligase subunit beta [Ketobacteraceae bacterium]|nr:phenylalanine--tRNA ligase subunit beta [Ketobacteraceae bacterium]